MGENDMIGSDLLRYNLKNKKFLVFDTETESLNLGRARAWEIGWVIYDGQDKIEEHQHYLKWPNLNVGKGARDVTGFSDELIDREGKEPKLVIDLFDSYIYNPEYLLIGANILNFDLYVHNTCRRNLGYKTDYSYLNRCYDTNSLAKAYKLQHKIPEKKEDFIPFQYRMSTIHKKGLKTSNSAMAKEFGMILDEKRLHQAIYDIEVTFFNFIKLVYALEIK